MVDKVMVLPLGLIYKEYNSGSRGYIYYILQKLNSEVLNSPCEQVATQRYADREMSIMVSTSNEILSRLVSEQERKKEEGGFPGQRYEGINHLDNKNLYLLYEDEFEDFINNHPNLLKKLKSRGIEELVRVL